MKKKQVPQSVSPESGQAAVDPSRSRRGARAALSAQHAPPERFNPLDKNNLGRSVVSALLDSRAVRLAELRPFGGPGIYAIYYVGPLRAYAAIAEPQANGVPQVPIYVGKASPKGGRKGGGTDNENGRPLYNRLRIHLQSIQSSSNLDVADFLVRVLVVDPLFITLAERALIAMYAPPWNVKLDGFGNKIPGKKRTGLLSRWDVFHGGRYKQQTSVPRKETSEQLETELTTWLESRPVPALHRTLSIDLSEVGADAEDDQ